MDLLPGASDHTESQGRRRTRRRRFWCSLTRLDVEVEFQERGLPGFGRQSAVLSCSVFDPPTAVACHRRCLDSRFRRQWDSALPVHTGRPCESRSALCADWLQARKR